MWLPVQTIWRDVYRCFWGYFWFSLLCVSGWRACPQVKWLEILLHLRPDVRVVVEQPAQSWMFKMPEFLRLFQQHNFRKVLTWMSFFNLPLPKPTHLMTNWDGCRVMARKMTKSAKEKFQRQLAKRKHVPTYYIKKVVDGVTTVQGTKALAKTAAYTPAFCRALMNAWRIQSGY